MIFNIILMSMYLTRWSERHYGIPAQTELQAIIDEDAPDDYMQSKFMEWEFLDSVIDNTINK